ncbi:MAG: hypothetical protein UU40_C0010G0015 [Candidatus Uhrbacteria bacterium GW2011_GWD2_41_121]|uniref:Uncharacterized protein n=1 Tax=Candidatus Uhrbacteria bacterium GW2011_GWC1_41_20 TaxID=1618983 RepID=A0A0G0VI75_9BACT|nr:MAG: hypothetical protein UT52_C0008G0014 [Candidatus Uhrbacteria bacterium GW2011_GWE1_39_46]KKR64067.1 MAG: hypothetical protein UU04_C0006G0014 [Candidatus Uhrbacteria bacterium GW2011_GWC2_40_450]KKR89455.1 MAG: hypothetical protein UU36_C0027G0005 [Candidatus Uhrbacteria bacterium GW2011_GWE2_41_1153]KKR89992.1 MAG: hypothetical protein UU40_C0010G0015 [Candidatus Uhrbacteria bacterium GW2011_GWD2_41_121]KKR95901.1 MAG: hypothetical protein UU46_C0011G0008 [Candidatus Uhrbacteria bacter
MTLSTHTAIGAVIGVSVGNPLLGFIIGFTSHFIIDMIPHGDSHISKNLRVHKKKKGAFAYGTIDSIIAVYLALILMHVVRGTSELAFTAAIAGSIMPDLLVGLHDLTKSKFLKPINDLHFYFHDFFIDRYHDIKLPTALFAQIILIALIMTQI